MTNHRAPGDEPMNTPLLHERWIYAKSNGVALSTFWEAEHEARAMCERNREAGIFTVGSNAAEMAALKRALDMRGGAS